MQELATLPPCWPVQFWFACDTNQIPCPASILKRSSNGAYDLMIATPNGNRTMKCCFRRGDPEIERRGPEVMERSGCWDLIDGFPLPPVPVAEVAAAPVPEVVPAEPPTPEEQRIYDLATQGKGARIISQIMGAQQWPLQRVEKVLKKRELAHA